MIAAVQESPPRSEPTGRSRLAKGAVVWFVIADVMAVVVIVGVGLVVARRIAVDEAVSDARGVVHADARHMAPELTDDVLAGDPAAVARLDTIVRDRVLSDEVIRVKVWDERGTIVYSDDAALVGETYGLGDEELESLRSGSTEAELSDLDRPENRDERRYGQLLEVYEGVETPAGQRLLYESYLRYDRVSSDGRRILGRFAPAVLGGVLALFALQIPLALALRQRVARAEGEQRRLLQEAVDSSERERRRIASDLHDSVVQGLAGTSLSLAALAEQQAARGDASTADRLRIASGELRQWVRELRTLIVNLVPRRLQEEGLGAAVTDLASSLDARGFEVATDIDPSLELAPATQALLFRSAQEAVRNVVEHAGASAVALTLGRVDGDRVRLVVTDDGRGLDEDALAEARAGGHVGLQLLGELVTDAGGTLTVAPAAGGGTVVTVEVSGS